MKMIKRVVLASILASADGSLASHNASSARRVLTSHSTSSARRTERKHLGLLRATDIKSRQAQTVHKIMAPSSLLNSSSHLNSSRSHPDLLPSSVPEAEEYIPVNEKELESAPKTNAKTNAKSFPLALLMNRMLGQLLFGLLYYYLIVSKYPTLRTDSKRKQRYLPKEVFEYRKQNVLMALTEASPKNIILSFCCTGPRAAHTFEMTHALNYWPALILGSMFPCCTLFYAEQFSDMSERLGGVKRSFLESVCCSMCCSCCVVTQDAQSLDMITGAETGFFGVDQKA